MSPVLVVAAVVVLVAAAAASYFFVVIPSGKTTTVQAGRTSTASNGSTSYTGTDSLTSSSSFTTSFSYTTSASTYYGEGCGPTTATTTGASVPYSNFTSLFSAFSTMGIHYNGTTGGNAFDFNSNYTVLGATANAYSLKVDFWSGANLSQYMILAWNNGTAASVDIGGANHTGSTAASYYLDAMYGFLFEGIYSSPGLSEVSGQGLHTTTGSEVHTTTGTATIGGTVLNVTNYIPNSLPLVVPSCAGDSTFSQYSLQLGSVSGSKILLATYLRINGTLSGAAGTQTIDVTFRITSLTRA